MTILDLGEGETAAIEKLHSQAGARRRIQSLGLFEGRRVRLIARGPFDGPLLVEDVESGSRVMIARELAGGIEVLSAPSD